MITTVATWNLHQAMDRKPANMAAAWKYLVEAIEPDVALVEESAHTPDAPGGIAVSRTDGAGFETLPARVPRRRGQGERS